MRQPTLWFLLADSARARVVRAPKTREPRGEQAPLETVFEASTDPRPAREIMADAPGRAFSSVGGRRSAMEYRSDPVREEATAFARSIIDELESRRGAGEFDALIVCAPPRVLGAIREVMPEGLKAVVRSETAKDLTKLPELELREALQRLVGGPD